MAQPTPIPIDKKTLKTKRQLLTTPEASEYLGVNEGTLRNWRSERVGRRSSRWRRFQTLPQCTGAACESY
jgi:hypothetical protein